MTAKAQQRTGRTLALLGALLAIASLAAGILVRGEDAKSQSGGAGKAVETDVVSIKDFKYAPAAIEVKAGTKVTFSNDDTAAHTATAEAFDTDSIRKGKKKTVTLKEPGTIAYICAFHPYMKGTVVVR